MTLAGHCDYVLSLALAAGAPVLASSGLRGQICLWDLHACAQAGTQVCILRPQKSNTSGCQVLHVYHCPAAPGISLGCTGLPCGSGKTCCARQPLFRCVWSERWAPARQSTASATVHYWQTPQVYYLSGEACVQRSRGPGRPAQGMACKGSVYALALNAPGSMVIAGTAESLVRVFDSRTGAKVMKLRGHTANVRWAS